MVEVLSQALAVAYGATPRQAGLDGHIIEPGRLQQTAAEDVPVKKTA